MPAYGLFPRALRIVAVAIAAAALMRGAVLAADSPPTPPAAIPESSAPLPLNPKALELPASALGENDQSKSAPWGDEKPDLKIPDEIQFGDNTLHFDATRTEQLPPGVETNEQAVINKGPTEPTLKPNYFGFRLTAPLR